MHLHEAKLMLSSKLTGSALVSVHRGHPQNRCSHLVGPFGSRSRLRALPSVQVFLTSTHLAIVMEVRQHSPVMRTQCRSWQAINSKQLTVVCVVLPRSMQPAGSCSTG